MRLGLVVYDGLDNTSGGYRYDRQLVDHLRERGHGVQVRALPARRYGCRLLDNVSTDVVADLSDWDVDVVLQDELCHPSLIRANRRLPAGTPIVSIVHHLRCSEPRSGWRTALTRAVERRYLDTVDAFVYNSEPTRDAVEALVGPTTGVVAPPAGDHFDPALSRDRIRTRAREDGPLRVVFVGSGIERKGLHTLLRGLADRPDGEWTLTVVGDRTVGDDYAGRIERLVDSLGVGQAVRFVGRVSDERLASILRRKHVLAVPSSYEGFGMVYLEGMGFGLPALASIAGGASDIVTPGETGFLVHPGDAEAVGAALGSLATDRDRLSEMGVAARSRFESHPTWSDVAERVEAFLEAM